MTFIFDSTKIMNYFHLCKCLRRKNRCGEKNNTHSPCCLVCVIIFTTFAEERENNTDMAYNLTNPNIDDTLNTIRLYAGVSTDASLAQKLEISKERLRHWRLRSVYDIDVIRKVFPELSEDWLSTGEGNPFSVDGVKRIFDKLEELRGIIEIKDSIINEQAAHIVKLTAYAKKKR